MERVRAPARGARKEPLSYLRTACRYDKEVIEFVKALLEHDRIDLDKKKKGAVASPPAPRTANGVPRHTPSRVWEARRC